MSLLYKVANQRKKRPHSIMWYHNRRKELGLPPRHMTTLEYIKYQKAFKKAKRRYNQVRGF